MKEQNPQLTSGFSAGQEALFVPGCWLMYDAYLFSINLFVARHVRKSYITHNISSVESKTRTHHGRVGSERRTAGGAAGRGRAGSDRSRRDADRTVRPGDHSLSCPPKYRKHMFRTSPQKREQAKLYLTRSVDSETRTYHGQVGSRRTAGQQSEVDQNRTSREQFAEETTVPRTPKNIKKIRVQNVSPEAQTSEILC